MIRLFRVFVPASAVALLLSEVILITFCFLLATYVVLEVDPTVFLLYDNGLTRILLVVGSILLGLHFQDLYSRYKVTSRVMLAQQLCLVMGLAFLAQALISYLNADLRLPIRIMVGGGFLTIVTIFSWRILYSAFVARVVGAQRILFVGNSPLLEDIQAHIAEHPELGLVSAGCIDDRLPDEEPRCHGKLLGPLKLLREIVNAVKPDRIIVGMKERRQKMPVEDLLELRLAGYFIEEAATAYENICGRISVAELRPAQLIFSGELGPRTKSVLFQTIFNLTFALVGTVLSLPLMLISALAVKFSSPGPVLYRQKRVGQDGAVFTLYKFRSMYVDAEARTGAVWATKDDPRITPVGRILRKLRLDELPQFFNVLRGEMSIVGPRPERPEFVQALSEQIPYYRQRHCVKPGITGWAQINYKYGDSHEDTIRKLEYDLYYIKNMSQSLDSYIVFHTVKTMLLSRGAQ